MVLEIQDAIAIYTDPPAVYGEDELISSAGEKKVIPFFLCLRKVDP
jgi:hypothetical protein